MSVSSFGNQARRDGIFYIILGLCVMAWSVAKGNIMVVGMSLMLVISGVLLWCRTVAGIWVTLLTDVLWIVGVAWAISDEKWGFKNVALMALMTYGLWSTWSSFGPILRRKATWNDPSDPEEAAELAAAAKSAEAPEEKPLISIVLLRRKRMALDEEILADIVRRAWSHPRLASPDPEELFAVGKEHMFIVRNPAAMWMVHNHAHPYLDKEAAAGDIRELRMAKAVADHEAWLSVDLLHPMDASLPLDIYYPYIFRLIAELADEDTLAIVRPETGQIKVWSEEIAASLGSAEPLEEFSKPGDPAVIRVEEDDAAMVAAVEKARATFPQFRERWETRKKGETFVVKGPITRGNRREFIWITVTELGYDDLRGTLGNEPVDLGGLKLGDEVDLLLADLNDWAVIPNDESGPLGFHTVAAVRDSRPN